MGYSTTTARFLRVAVTPHAHTDKGWEREGRRTTTGVRPRAPHAGRTRSAATCNAGARGVTFCKGTHTHTLSLRLWHNHANSIVHLTRCPTSVQRPF